MVSCAGVHAFGGPGGGPGGALQGVQVKLNTSQWWQLGRALQIVQKPDGCAALAVAERRRVVCKFRRITILTRFVFFVIVFIETVPFVVVCGGLVFPFLCCTLSCSVFSSICVQSGRVEMEYGGGEIYELQ